MPDLPLGNHIFDLEFHPQSDYVYAGLLTGEIKGYAYDTTNGLCQAAFTLRPTKRSCRGLATNESGDRLWSVSKDKAIHGIDTNSGKVVDTRLGAHDSAINRVTRLLPNMLATGDDDGVIKLWDPRKPAQLREYKQHFDFISDFMWLEDKRQLVATRYGDGTLSVMDVRSNKPEPIAQSEDQEDELLSIVPIKGNNKFVVGTQLGILSIFNRSKGWGDCVDRIPGHPSSIDALCALTQDVILTGSSDGFIRAVEILPTKFLGVIADHGEFPIERIKLDRQAKWLGSASHDEVLKLTDVGDALEESDEEEDRQAEREQSMAVDGDEKEDGGEAGLGDMSAPARQEATTMLEDDSDEPDSDEGEKQKKRKRRKRDQHPGGSHKKANAGPDASFFSEL
ncbi:WD40-repeat-containing domain protein [Gautieria morchelliformis]|nr:WD40-repeat-containing domain protein [Gautieria morchelliformis]